MSSQNNSFEDLLRSFSKVLSFLENETDAKLHEIEKNCAEEFNLGAKTLNAFNDLISGISETYSELSNTNEIVKLMSQRANEESVLALPYEIQSPLVKCINELYHTKLSEMNFGENKFINEKNNQLISEIINASEKNIIEIKNVQNSVLEA